MKRLIAALGVGWGLIYATNHLLLPRAPTKSKVAVQSEQTSTNRSINSWGPYLSDVKPEPNNMAQTSLKSRQTQEPAASEAELMPSSSLDIKITQKPSPWKSAPYELLAWKTLQRPPYASTMAAHHPYRTLNPTQKPSRWKSGPYELLTWKTLQRPPYASTMAAHHPYRTLNPTQKPSRWKSGPYVCSRGKPSNGRRTRARGQPIILTGP